MIPKGPRGDQRVPKEFQRVLLAPVEEVVEAFEDFFKSVARSMLSQCATAFKAADTLLNCPDGYGLECWRRFARNAELRT